MHTFRKAKSRANSSVHNELQGLPTTTGTSQNRRGRGRPRQDFPASTSPSINDIIYASAFYEGEGNYKNKRVSIVQNDRQKLDWLQVHFGGKVYGPYTGKPKGNDYYVLVLVHERALGFMFTIFTHLSVSRREQFKLDLQGKANKREYQPTINDNGISEAYLKRNLERSINRQSNRTKSAMGIFGVRK